MFQIPRSFLIPFLVAAAVHVCLRLSYFFWIGFTLRHEQARDSVTEDHHRRWSLFRSRASILLEADAATFALAAYLAAGSIHLGLTYLWLVAVGLVLITVGVWVKIEAIRVVGEKGYYWYNSFCPEGRTRYAPLGIYRWLKNPMYGAGYLQAPGFALVLASGPGLGLAFFDWGVVWAFYFAFEAPHTRQLAAARAHATCRRGS